MSVRRRYIFPDDYILRDAVLFPDDSAPQSFSYSDGDEAENYLLEVLSKAKDRSLFSEELRAAIRDWPSRYHLSRKRANLLRPFAPFLRGRVLETGAGCGAITRFLGENGGEIVAVEGSARRAKIARVRTEDLANVTVVCGRVENLRAVEKFDAITVVGVLEYAGVYDNDDPYRKFLRDVASKLSDDGVVILAIENKLGLKYLAGAREDHTGGEFDGINDGYRAKSPTTFGGAELAGLLRDSGLTAQAWYVPSPDYKLPDTILSGALITAHPGLAASLASQTALSDPQRPSDPTFSLEQAWQVVGKNYLLGELANSFLVVCAKNESAIIPFKNNDGLAWHYNVERHAAFTKATEFVRAGEGIRVERHALGNADAPSVPISQQLSGEPFREGKNWWGELSGVVNRPNWTVGEVADWAKVWLQALARECGLKNVSAEIFPRYVDGKYFDAAPFNLSVDEEGNAHFFDQEWKLGPQVEFGYLAFRGLRDSLARIFSYATPEPGTPHQINQLIIAVLAELGIFLTRSQIDRFTEIEGRVQAWVQGQSAADISQEYIAQSWNAVISVRSGVERSALSASIGHLRSENSRLQGVEDELSKSQASQSLLQSDLVKAREDNAALTSQLSANADLLRESQGLTQKLSGDLAETQKRLGKAIDRSQELSSALESERATAKELLRKIAERDALVDLRTGERDAASGKLAQLEVLLEQESRRANELSAALEAERTSVSKKQSELAESHRLAELLTRERDGASRQLAQVFSELSRSRQSSAQLQNERARAEQLAAELERDRGELRFARAHADRLSNGLAEQARILEGVENRESRQRGFIGKLFSGASGAPTASERLQIDAIRSSKLFSAVTYLQRYPDVASARMNPLLHYIRYGENEARQVHYLFDAAYYRRNCVAASRVKMTSLAHYQSIGILSGNDPHALFDTDFYMKQLGDKSASTLNPVAHFCEEGWRAGMNPHPLFDTKYYLLQNPDVQSAGENPLIHYCVFGWRELRNPSAAFDVSFYLREHRDVALANTDPLAHYSEYGKAEGRTVRPVG